MRKALIIGIDYYTHLRPLGGCVNDAYGVKAVLERNADGTPNFVTPRLIAGAGPSEIVTRSEIKDAVRELFDGDSDIALLYFAGHGYIDETGGFLCSGDCKTGDAGTSLPELMTLAGKSKAKNKIIVLDSCHSGIAGERSDTHGFAEIKEGTTILTASTAEQYAAEIPGGGAGVFTKLFVDALNGAAANLVGDITPGSIYAHIDQSLGPWAQRPVFKTNVKSFVSLRKVTPPIPLADLHALATLFPVPGYELQLDPAYEPERVAPAETNLPPPDPKKTAVFAVLQKYAKVNLLRPVGAPHMWHAAMEGKSCKLTVLGEHYRDLVARKLL
jgi:hypothetical protein